MHQEIRALPCQTVADLLRAIPNLPKIEILDTEQAREIREENTEIITSNERVCKEIREKYFPLNTYEIDSFFLRWDESNVNSAADPKADRISEDKIDREMITRTQEESINASDWWRRVGAAIVKNGTLFSIEHNIHIPSEHIQYSEGDPRDVIPAGSRSDLSTALHAEQLLISKAARTGSSLEGSDIYVSVFPCAVCAKLIASSGIKRCFYSSGFASLDGERVLRAFGVEIIFVK